MKEQKKTKTKEKTKGGIISHRGSLFVMLTALAINIGIWFFMFYKKQANDYPLPLHYDVYQGVDVIDVWSKLYYLPILGLIIIAINYVLSTLVSPKDEVIMYFLNIASVLVQIILFVALFWIIYLQNDLFQL